MPVSQILTAALVSGSVSLVGAMLARELRRLDTTLEQLGSDVRRLTERLSAHDARLTALEREVSRG